jgi:hypothetical protein
MGYMFLNYRKVISGQQMSFYTFATLVLFYAFLLSEPHLSYVQSCLNLTLAVIFAGLVLRWPLRYGVVVSVMGLLLYPASIYFLSDTSLSEFFEQGGVFVMAAHVLFPFVVKMNHNKDKREFYFRYTLQQQNEALETAKNHRRTGNAGQNRLPFDDEPRDPHAAERDCGNGAFNDAGRRT